jgi:hypothetical protein
MIALKWRVTAPMKWMQSTDAKSAGCFQLPPRGTSPFMNSSTYKPEDIRRNDVFIFSSAGRHGIKIRHRHHSGNTLLYNKCYEERDAFERTVGLT